MMNYDVEKDHKNDSCAGRSKRDFFNYMILCIKKGPLMRSFFGGGLKPLQLIAQTHHAANDNQCRAVYLLRQFAELR